MSDADSTTDNETPGRRGILVLGMHRSGTSALTRIINLLGADLSKDITPPHGERNEAGYWEPRELVLIHEELLALGDSRWDDPREFPTRTFELPQARALRSRIIDIIEADFASSRLFVLKDPRICRFVPFWLSIFQELSIEPLIVLAVRHPLEIADSLQKRDGIHPSKSCLLWLRHLIDAERDTRGLPRTLVTYNQIMVDWTIIQDKLTKTLGIRWPSEYPDHSDALGSFIDSSLRHHCFTESDLNLTGTMGWIRELERAVLSVCETNDLAPLSNALDRISPQFAMATDVSGDVLACVDILSSVKSETEERYCHAYYVRDRDVDVSRSTVSLLREQLSAQHRTESAWKDKVTKKEIEIAKKEVVIDRLRHSIQPGLLPRLFWRVTHNLAALLGELINRGPKGGAQLVRDYFTLAKSARFDADWYLGNYPDLLRLGVNPVLHYLRHGAAEGRAPSPEFSSRDYLSLNPDVAAAGLNPLVHYVRFGAREKRPTKPVPIPKNPKVKPPVAANIFTGDATPLRSLQADACVPGKIAVYTAVTGGYDHLRSPEIVSPRCDYICFSDTTISDPGLWKVHGVDYFNADTVRAARYVKTHPHVYLPDYTWSIWIDANLLIRMDLADLIDAMNSDLHVALFIHPDRHCIYDEGQTIIRRRLDDPNVARLQMDRYRNHGFHSIGLHETNVLVRRHNEPDVISLNNRWWSEIENGSRRDQMSFNYAAWKQGIQIGDLAPRGISVRNDPRFQRYAHGQKGLPC